MKYKLIGADHAIEIDAENRLDAYAKLVQQITGLEEDEVNERILPELCIGNPLFELVECNEIPIIQEVGQD